MIYIVWRIEKAKHLAAAKSGEGARFSGGRWTSPGSRVIYCAQHLSLAILEVLVHAPDPSQRLVARVRFRIRLHSGFVEYVRDRQLPSNFSPRTPYDVTRTIGDEWLQRAGTPVLSVPSAIVPIERNFILNPEHPRFGKLTWSTHVPISLDNRLWTMPT